MKARKGMEEEKSESARNGDVMEICDKIVRKGRDIVWGKDSKRERECVCVCV